MKSNSEIAYTAKAILEFKEDSLAGSEETDRCRLKLSVKATGSS